MDMRGGGDMRFFRSMGVLTDLTDSAKAMGFDPSRTYPAATGEITFDGRQYAFPCNVSTHGYWINKDVFARAGVQPPGYRWTIEEFESIGKELCDKANAGLSRRQVFFCSQVEYQTFARSMGLDRYNETMTRCILDDERFVELLGKVYKWTYVDNIMPTPEDSDAFAAQQAGYGGGAFQLFNRGHFAMLYSGRYALIQVRKFNEIRKARGEKLLNLAVVEPPNGGLPNTNIVARAASVYQGSAHPEYAMLFLSFLASEEYNMQIIDDGDSLPPIPKYTQTEAFLHPPGYPDEWKLHEPFARMADEIAIENSYSPFIADRTFMRLQSETLALLLAHRLNARDAAKSLADKVNAEIQRGVSENPAMKELYERMLAQQRQIDDWRASGKPVPVELISNPFYRVYYAHNGWLTSGNRLHAMEITE
jgi:multiple sugar transport system substrate-binding protein